MDAFYGRLRKTRQTMVVSANADRLQKQSEGIESRPEGNKYPVRIPLPS